MFRPELKREENQAERLWRQQLQALAPLEAVLKKHCGTLEQIGELILFELLYPNGKDQGGLDPSFLHKVHLLPNLVISAAYDFPKNFLSWTDEEATKREVTRAMVAITDSLRAQANTSAYPQFVQHLYVKLWPANPVQKPDSCGQLEGRLQVYCPKG